MPAKVLALCTQQSEVRYLRTLSKRELRSLSKQCKPLRSHKVPLKFQLLQHSGIDSDVKMSLLQLMKNEHDPKIFTKIEHWMRMPPKQDKPAPNASESLRMAAEVFEKQLYGQDKTKQAIMRYLCAQLYQHRSVGRTIALCGPPGNGKTTLLTSCLSKVLQRPFKIIPMGGCTDASFLYGHQFCYEGSHPGQIVKAFQDTQSCAPIIVFDEIDKIAKDEVVNALLHITDSSQNHLFADKYLDSTVDLSHVLFGATFNDRSKVNPVLLDRLDVIQTDSYNAATKVSIAQQHLWPKLLSNYEVNFKPSINEELLRWVVSQLPQEGGVRTLNKVLKNTIESMLFKWTLHASSDCDEALQVQREDVVFADSEAKDDKPEHMYL